MAQPNNNQSILSKIYDIMGGECTIINGSYEFNIIMTEIACDITDDYHCIYIVRGIVYSQSESEFSFSSFRSEIISYFAYEDMRIPVVDFQINSSYTIEPYPNIRGGREISSSPQQHTFTCRVIVNPEEFVPKKKKRKILTRNDLLDFS